MIELDTEETVETLGFENLEEQGQFLGCSEKQIAWVWARLQGANFTQCAKSAGYKGTDDGLRKVGSNVARSKKVQALLAWAETIGAGSVETEGDHEELRKILWRHARGRDVQKALDATKQLDRIIKRDKELAEKNKVGDPKLTIPQFADVKGWQNSLPVALNIWFLTFGTIRTYPNIEQHSTHMILNHGELWRWFFSAESDVWNDHYEDKPEFIQPPLAEPPQIR